MTTRRAARLDDETLIGLIEDVRSKPHLAAEEAEAYERSLAELLAEAASRSLLACITIDLEHVRAQAQKMDQEKIRSEIRQAATLQQLQRYAGLLEQADLNGLWIAYRWAAMFKDENERFLALQHIAWHVSRWLCDDADEVEAMEVVRTEQLAQVPAPGRWLEQEVIRLFHHTLRSDGDPTGSADGVAAGGDQDEEEDVRSSRRPGRKHT